MLGTSRPSSNTKVTSPERSAELGGTTSRTDAGAWAVEQSELCHVAAQQAERQYHLPQGLLIAIAKAESGRPIIRPRAFVSSAHAAALTREIMPYASITR